MQKYCFITSMRCPNTHWIYVKCLYNGTVELFWVNIITGTMCAMCVCSCYVTTFFALSLSPAFILSVVFAIITMIRNNFDLMWCLWETQGNAYTLTMPSFLPHIFGWLQLSLVGNRIGNEIYSTFSIWIDKLYKGWWCDERAGGGQAIEGGNVVDK